MRALMLASILASFAAGAAAAQAPEANDPRSAAERALFAMAQPSRQQASPSARPGAVLTLEDLAAQQAASDALSTEAIEAGAEIGEQIGADSLRIEQLMDSALSRGNARIMAVKPVVR